MTALVLEGRHMFRMSAFTFTVCGEVGRHLTGPFTAE